ncbi:MAG TPA: protein-methionine-sulfoxide reductase heme-binding subunit MsrQ [Blastocatellia bacterium]|nr:protein-methionine-sulfoxide reductase heme-binding subunit MsrQ [Blastocatellia bacterium]
MTEIRFNQSVVFVNSLVPLVLLGWDGYHKKLGANPLEYITHTTGILTLLFLLLTLAITPARKITGIPWLIRLRRMLGLYAFFYGALHLICYMWFDKSFAIVAIGKDILVRPFIAIGMTSFFLMVPLAITSTNKMLKRIGGKRWQKLHRLVYLSAAAGVLHYWMLVKADTRIPLAFGFVLALLLGYRIIDKYFPDLTQKRTARA